MAEDTVPAQNGVATSGGGGVPFCVPSLYVTDLDSKVTDADLYDLFNGVGLVISVRVCRDMSTRGSLGYGYVNYTNCEDAARAMKDLNFTSLCGKSIRIMYSNRNSSARNNGANNLFIKNLDKTIDNKALYDMFSSFGDILSCKVAADDSGKSKGYGFVQFDNEESAQKAIDNSNSMLSNDKRVFVGHFISKQERETVLNKTKCNNFYVKNLSELTTDEDLQKIFGEYGPITSAVVMRDGEGKSKCFGFVNFSNADDAAKAVEALNGKKFGGKDWYIGKAQKKSERELELKSRFEQSAEERVDMFQGLNLYVKNLDDSIDDKKFKELFIEFGRISSCKVLRDPSGISRGSGFVAFSNPEEASHAFVEMNGKMVLSKPLFVAIAQPKEERRAWLQAQSLQMQPAAMAQSIAPRMPLTPPSAPGLGQQLCHGQASFAIIPQAGYGYQQLPGMRPGAVQQVQQGPHPSARRGAGLVHQPQQPVAMIQQPVAMMQQQMHPRGHVYGYPPHVTEVLTPGVARSMLSVPYGMVTRDALQPMVVPTFASTIANAPLEQQRADAIHFHQMFFK